MKCVGKHTGLVQSVRRFTMRGLRVALLLFGGVSTARCLLGPAVAQAQNLVPNPSFETYSQCPDFPDQIDRANPWTMPTLKTYVRRILGGVRNFPGLSGNEGNL